MTTFFFCWKFWDIINYWTLNKFSWGKYALKPLKSRSRKWSFHQRVYAENFCFQPPNRRGGCYDIEEYYEEWWQGVWYEQQKRASLLENLTCPEQLHTKSLIWASSNPQNKQKKYHLKYTYLTHFIAFLYKLLLCQEVYHNFFETSACLIVRISLQRPVLALWPWPRVWQPIRPWLSRPVSCQRSSSAEISYHNNHAVISCLFKAHRWAKAWN